MADVNSVSVDIDTSPAAASEKSFRSITTNIGKAVEVLTTQMMKLSDAQERAGRSGVLAGAADKAAGGLTKQAREALAAARAEAQLLATEGKLKDAYQLLSSALTDKVRATTAGVRAAAQLAAIQNKIIAQDRAEFQAEVALAGAQKNRALQLQLLYDRLKTLTAGSLEYLQVQKQIASINNSGGGGGGGGGGAPGGGGFFGSLGGALQTLRSVASAIVSVYIVARTMQAALETAIGPFVKIAEAGIKFNTVLEQSSTGIAGLYAQLGQFTDVTGGSVKGVAAFRSALLLAKEDVLALQVAGLKTSATTEELVQAFQTSLGAGLGAGLGRDQIRNLTVDITQAARAIGLPLNQLSQEVRAIFEGTIDRNARVANVLNIRNEDINKWKQMGTLATELQARLSAFREIGPIIEKTFEGATSNLLEFFQTFSAVATGPLFDTLRDKIVAINKSLINSDAKGSNIADVLTPQASSVANSLQNVFGGAARGAGAIIDALQGQFKSLGDTLKENQGSVETIARSIDGLGRIAAVVINSIDSGDAIQKIADSIRIVTYVIGGLIDILRVLDGLVGLVRNGIGYLVSTVIDFIPYLGNLNKSAFTTQIAAAAVSGEWYELSRIFSGSTSAINAVTSALNASTSAISRQAEAARTLAQTLGYVATAAQKKIAIADAAVDFQRGEGSISERFSAGKLTAEQRDAELKELQAKRDRQVNEALLPIPGIIGDRAAELKRNIAAVAGIVDEGERNRRVENTLDAFGIGAKSAPIFRKYAAQVIKARQAEIAAIAKREKIGLGEASELQKQLEQARGEGFVVDDYAPNPRAPRGGAGKGKSTASTERALARERLALLEDFYRDRQKLTETANDLYLRELDRIADAVRNSDSFQQGLLAGTGSQDVTRSITERMRVEFDAAEEEVRNSFQRVQDIVRSSTKEFSKLPSGSLDFLGDADFLALDEKLKNPAEFFKELQNYSSLVAATVKDPTTLRSYRDIGEAALVAANAVARLGALEKQRSGGYEVTAFPLGVGLPTLTPNTEALAKLGTSEKLPEFQTEFNKQLKVTIALMGTITPMDKLNLELTKQRFDIEQQLASATITQAQAKELLLDAELNQSRARIAELNRLASLQDREGGNLRLKAELLEEIYEIEHRISRIPNRTAFFRGFASDIDTVSEKFEQFGDTMRNVLTESIRDGFRNGLKSGILTLLDGIAGSLLDAVADTIALRIATAIKNKAGSGGLFGGILDQLEKLLEIIFRKPKNGGGVPGVPGGGGSGPIPGAPNSGPAPDPRGIGVDYQAEAASILRAVREDVRVIPGKLDEIISLLQQILDAIREQTRRLSESQGPSLLGSILGGAISGASSAGFGKLDIKGGLGKLGGFFGGGEGVGNLVPPGLEYPDFEGIPFSPFGDAVSNLQAGNNISVNVYANNPAEFFAAATQDQLASVVGANIRRTQRLSG